MTLPILDVDLSLPPRARWRCLVGHETGMRALVATYTHDLGGIDLYREMIVSYRDTLFTGEQLEEMEAIAEIASLDPLEVILVNAYYDVFKHVMGCTAFAVDGEGGPIHGRNLDWWTEGGALATTSVIVRYRRGETHLFDAITWPGFVGTLSGMAPGRFSVTLNAVISDETPGIAQPVSLLLRELLERATYAEAKHALSTRPLVCDCLFLLAGTETGELCAIERTPTRGVVREAEGGVVVVANDYRALEAPGWERATNTLASTSCGRFDRARARAVGERPTDVDACYAILDDTSIKMKITVQQMVMSAARRLVSARIPT